jgi:glycosyltransferase involved in cell wall biosynthesis
MPHLRIAHLARWLEVGGTEQVIYNLCKFGTQRQWVVGLQDGPMRRVLEDAGIEVRLAPTAGGQAEALADADVVNVHWLEHNPTLLVPAMAARKPLVFTQHGLAALPPLPGAVVCTSQSTFAIQRHNRERCVIIPNAVDLTRFEVPPCRPEGFVRVIRVCRPVRCADYFWKSMAQVLDQCPEAEVQIVGGEPFKKPRIEGLGDRHDVARHLACAHVFAYAPLPHEGTLDLVVLEAMASGLPCVVTDVKCVRESVRHGVTGLVSAFGDTEAFAQNVIRLVRDPQLRESMGREAALVARERFDFRKRVPLHETVYRKVATAAVALPARDERATGAAAAVA